MKPKGPRGCDQPWPAEPTDDWVLRYKYQPSRWEPSSPCVVIRRNKNKMPEVVRKKRVVYWATMAHHYKHMRVCWAWDPNHRANTLKNRTSSWLKRSLTRKKYGLELGITDFAYWELEEMFTPAFWNLYTTTTARANPALSGAGLALRGTSVSARLTPG